MNRKKPTGRCVSCVDVMYFPCGTHAERVGLPANDEGHIRGLRVAVDEVLPGEEALGAHQLGQARHLLCVVDVGVVNRVQQQPIDRLDSTRLDGFRPEGNRLIDWPTYLGLGPRDERGARVHDGRVDGRDALALHLIIIP